MARRKPCEFCAGSSTMDEVAGNGQLVVEIYPEVGLIGKGEYAAVTHLRSDCDSHGQKAIAPCTPGIRGFGHSACRASSLPLSCPKGFPTVTQGRL